MISRQDAEAQRIDLPRRGYFTPHSSTFTLLLAPLLAQQERARLTPRTRPQLGVHARLCLLQSKQRKISFT